MVLLRTALLIAGILLALTVAALAQTEPPPAELAALEEMLVQAQGREANLTVRAIAAERRAAAAERRAASAEAKLTAPASPPAPAPAPPAAK